MLLHVLKLTLESKELEHVMEMKEIVIGFLSFLCRLLYKSHHLICLGTLLVLQNVSFLS
jgi:hypothetical protein